MTTRLVIVLLLATVVGCAESNVATTDVTKPEATAVAFNTAGAPTVQFEVPDMMCKESCAKAVRETLAAQPGAMEVVVDFPKKIATVAIDEKAFSSDDALAALLDKQFTEAKLYVAPEGPALPASPEAPAVPEPTEG